MTTLPSGALLFDTGVYIRLSRRQDYLWLREDPQVFRRTILSAVVAAELYAGTSNAREKRALDQLCQAHRSHGHFSTPGVAEWTETGVLLGRARRSFGHLDFVSHFRDLLIALEAARVRATLVMENCRDFERWKKLLASSGKTLKLFDPGKIGV